MNGNKVTDTAFFKMLVEINDREEIACHIVRELLNQCETSFKIMQHFGHEKIDVSAIYDVADKIVAIKK